jgi:hypothetical protein
MRKIVIADTETIDLIVDQGLTEIYSNLRADYKSRKSGTGMAIFDTDMDTDIKEIRKLIKAFKLVMKYCCADNPDNLDRK